MKKLCATCGEREAKITGNYPRCYQWHFDKQKRGVKSLMHYFAKVDLAVMRSEKYQGSRRSKLKSVK